jgi:hypothetical protein
MLLETEIGLGHRPILPNAKNRPRHDLGRFRFKEFFIRIIQESG